MTRDADDKSLFGRFSKLHDKRQDGQNRRSGSNDRVAQKSLDDGFRDMALQQPASEASLDRMPDEPPEYSNQGSAPLPPSKALPRKLDKRDQEQKPMPRAPPAVEASSSTAPSPFASNFASLSLHMYDRIRLLDFPRPVIDLVRTTLQYTWQRGIQDECPYHGSHEFKLRGYPWSYTSGSQSIDAHRLTRHLFEVLYDNGWVLSLSTDISRKKTDKDTLIFRHQIPSPMKCEWITVDFPRGDRIRVLDAPRNLLDAIYAQLRPAIQEQMSSYSPGVWEIKMHGYPWRASGGETMNARRLLLQLFAVLERFGFTVYASVDQESVNSDNASDADTWQCLRPVTWTPGAPVYHA